MLNPPTPPHNLSPNVRFQQDYAAEGIRLHLDVYYDPMRSTPLGAHDPAVPWGRFLLRWKMHYRHPSGGEYRLIAKSIRVLAEWGYALEYDSWGVELSSNRRKALEETVRDNFMDFPFSTYQRAARVEAELEEKEPLRCWLTLWRYNWQDFHLLAVDFPPGRHLSTGDLTVLVHEIKIVRTDHLTLTAPLLPWKRPQPEISLFEFRD